MEKILENYKHYLGLKRKSGSTIRNYVSDAKKFLTWHQQNNLPAGTNVSDQITSQTFQQYKIWLTKNNTPAKTINRILAGLRSFGEFLSKEKLLIANPASQVQNVPKEQIIKENPILDTQQKLSQLTQNHRKTLIITISILAVVIIGLILGIIAYFKAARKSKTGEQYQIQEISLPQSRTSTNTNGDDNQGVQYVVDPQTGETISITPNGTCDYCLNARALQGYTPSASGSASKVVVLSEDGDLILGEDSPSIYAPVGGLELNGQSLNLITDTGSDGDITLSPDGQGAIQIHLGSTTGDHFNLTNANISSGALLNAYAGNSLSNYDLLRLSSGLTEIERFSISSLGDMFLARNATISGSLKASSALIQGWQTDLLQVKNSSGTTLFNLDNLGSLGVSESIYHLGDTDTYLAFTDDSLTVDIGLAGFLQFTENDTQDILAGNYDRENIDFVWHGEDTSDTTPAFYIDASNARVGIGTNAPAFKFDVRSTSFFEGEMRVAGNIIPHTDDSYDLGSSSLEWQDIYIDGTAYIDTASIGATTMSGDLDMGNNLILNIGSAGTDFTSGGGLTLAGTLTANGTLDANGAFTLGDGGDTGAIDTSDWDIDVLGNISNIGTIGMDGNLTLTKADPSIIFDVATATDTDFWLGVQDDGASDDNDLFQIGDGTTPGTNPFLTIDTAGNVGIGTIIPGAKLSFVTATTAAGGIDFGGDVTLYREKANYLQTDDTFNALEFLFTNVDSSGLSPSGSNVVLHSQSNVTSNIVMKPGWADGSTAQFQIYDDFDDANVFTVDLTGKTYIAGNLGIGTTDPDAKLHVVDGDVYIAGDSGYSFDNPSANEDLYVEGNIEVDGNLFAGGSLIGPWLVDNVTIGTEPDTLYYNTYPVVVGDATALTDNTPLTNAGFILNQADGNDLYVQDLLGVGDTLYAETNVIIGHTLTLADGSITQSTGSPLSVVLGGAAGDDFIVDTDTLVVESDNDQVGIGTTAPTAKLEISGGTTVPLNLQRTSSSIFLQGGLNGATNYFNIGQLSWGDRTIYLSLGGPNGFPGEIRTHSNADLRLDPAGTGDLDLRLNDVGSVLTTGLGESSQISLGANLNQNDIFIKRDVDGASSFSEAGALLRLEKDVTNVTSEEGYFLEWADTTAGTLGVIDYTGNVGIGTDDPGYNLEIAESSSEAQLSLFNQNSTMVDGSNVGTINFRGIESLPRTGAMIRAEAYGDWNALNVTSSPTELAFYIEDSEYSSHLSNPRLLLNEDRMELLPTDGADLPVTFRLSGNSYGSAEMSAIEFYQTNTRDNMPAVLGKILVGQVDGTQGYMSFYTNNNAVTPSEAMRIDASGNVGINATTNLGAKLEVNAATASDIGAIFQTTDNDSTNNLTEWQNSSGSTLGYVSSTGATQLPYLGLGTTPSTNNRETVFFQPSTASGTYRGLSFDVRTPYTAGNMQLYAITGSTYVNQAQTNTIASITVNSTVGGNTTFTQNNLFGIKTRVSNFSDDAAVLTNAYPLYVEPPQLTGDGTITNYYGLYMESLTDGTSSNYAIYTNLGDVSLGDDLLLRNDSDRLQIGAGGDLDLYHDSNNSYITNATGDLYITDTGTDDVLLSTNGGYVGIGTNDPTQQLELTGSIELAPTTSSSIGVIYKGNNPFIHDYAPGGATSNLFVGNLAGNFTMTQPDSWKGINNVGLGYHSLNDLTWGYSNTAIGSGTLDVNTEGYQNVAIGYGSLGGNLTGDLNVAIGSLALSTSTAADSNTAIGSYALEYTTGGGNTALGRSALERNSAGATNTALGGYAIQYNITGNCNTAIGYQAARGVENNSFSNNTILGYYAGHALTTGSNNILTGFGTGDNLTTGENNILIGYDIEAPAVDSSQMMSLGNLIFATGLDGTGTTISTGYVGIGTTAPDKALEINHATGANLRLTYNDSDGSATNYADFSMADDGALTIQTAGTDEDIEIRTGTFDNAIFIDNSAAGVGIGTTDPDARLQVGDTTANTANMLILGKTAATGTVNLPRLHQANVLSTGNDLAIGAASSAGGILFYTGDVTGQTSLLGTNNNALRMVIDGGGDVGIGENAPAANLEVEVDDNVADQAGILIDYNDTTNNNYALEINNAGTGHSIYDDSGAHLTAAGSWNNAPSYSWYKDKVGQTVNYLDKLDQLEINEWQFKDEVIDGQNRYQADSDHHASPFLDDFYRVFGLANLEGVNVQDLAGVALASIKELNQRFKQTIQSYALEFRSQKIISPLVETENLVAQVIEADLIKPATNKELAIQLDQNQKEKFVIKNQDNQNLFALDTQGNATFSGQLTAQGASISGELIADSAHFKKLYADQIDGLEDKVATLAGNTVNNYYYESSTPSENDDSLSTGLTEDEEASYSALTNSIINPETLSLNNDQYLDISNIDTDSILVDEFLAVLGQAVITNLEVTNALVVNDSLQISNNSITSTEQLYLQPSGLGAINMMAGKFIIDKSGDVYINGSLTVAEAINSSEINTNNLNSNEASISGKLAVGQLEIANGIGGFGLDASGSAKLSKINIASSFEASKSAEASMSAQIATNATAGKAVLPALETQLQILNQNITKGSLIYITPTSDTQNKVLYVKNKKDGIDGYFTVALDKPILKDIEFNWWIIN